MPWRRSVPCRVRLGVIVAVVDVDAVQVDCSTEVVTSLLLGARALEDSHTEVGVFAQVRQGKDANATAHTCADACAKVSNTSDLHICHEKQMSAAKDLQTGT